jgi:hypothetical protein
MEEMRNSYRIVGKSERKRPLERLTCIWEDNIKMYLRKIGLEGVDSIHPAQHINRRLAVVNTVMNLRIP